MTGNEIWVVLQHREGKLHRMSWEAIAAGQRLASLAGGEASAVLLGAETGALAEEVAGRADLAAVRRIDAPALADYTPGGYVGALARALGGDSPRWVVFPHTYQTVDYVPRLAQAVDAALVPEIVACEEADGEIRFRRPVLGGKLQATVRVKGEGRALLSVQSGAFSPDDVEAGSAGIEQVDLGGAAVEADREILGVEEVAGEQVDLSAADVIVGVGRGVGGEEKIGVAEELAKALGGELGASRPVIDSGWLPRDRQIGSSGQTVAPKLYVALGISGAIQHLVGMKGAQVVVAVNKDASAPIFGIARYGIVGDLHEYVPAITAAIREARES